LLHYCVLARPKQARENSSLLRSGRIRRVKTAIHELLPAAADFPLAQRTCNRVERRALRQRHPETETDRELKSRSSRASRPGSTTRTNPCNIHKQQRGSTFTQSLPASPTKQTRPSHSHARLASRSLHSPALHGTSAARHRAATTRDDHRIRLQQADPSSAFACPQPGARACDRRTLKTRLLTCLAVGLTRRGTAS